MLNYNQNARNKPPINPLTFIISREWRPCFTVAVVLFMVASWSMNMTTRRALYYSHMGLEEQFIECNKTSKD